MEDAFADWASLGQDVTEYVKTVTTASTVSRGATVGIHVAVTQSLEDAIASPAGWELLASKSVQWVLTEMAV